MVAPHVKRRRKAEAEAKRKAEEAKALEEAAAAKPAPAPKATPAPAAPKAAPVAPKVTQKDWDKVEENLAAASVKPVAAKTAPKKTTAKK